MSSIDLLKVKTGNIILLRNGIRIKVSKITRLPESRMNIIADEGSVITCNRRGYVISNSKLTQQDIVDTEPSTNKIKRPKVKAPKLNGRIFDSISVGLWIKCSDNFVGQIRAYSDLSPSFIEVLAVSKTGMIRQCIYSKRNGRSALTHQPAALCIKDIKPSTGLVVRRGGVETSIGKVKAQIVLQEAVMSVRSVGKPKRPRLTLDFETLTLGFTMQYTDRWLGVISVLSKHHDGSYSLTCTPRRGTGAPRSGVYSRFGTALSPQSPSLHKTRSRPRRSWLQTHTALKASISQGASI
jgi:hypothetical protein